VLLRVREILQEFLLVRRVVMLVILFVVFVICKNDDMVIISGTRRRTVMHQKASRFNVVLMHTLKVVEGSESRLFFILLS